MICIEIYINNLFSEPRVAGTKVSRYGGQQMTHPLHKKIVGHPEPEKKILLAFLSTFWHPCSKCILMCFKKDRGGCQVWKCPKVPELGQRSTECKFLHIRQILAFLTINYPKL